MRKLRITNCGPPSQRRAKAPIEVGCPVAAVMRRSSGPRRRFQSKKTSTSSSAISTSALMLNTWWRRGQERTAGRSTGVAVGAEVIGTLM
jgi:hypothetical protein